MRYRDFIVQITATRDHALELRVSRSPAGESEAVPVGPDSPLGVLLDRTRADPTYLDGQLLGDGGESLGGLLYRAIVHDAVRARFLEALGRLETSDQERAGLRIQIEIDLGSQQLAEVHALPWELLYRPETGTFFALDRRFAIVRRLRLPVAREITEIPQRLKLLVAVAAPRDRELLDTMTECRSIADSWAQNSGLEIHFLAQATLETLRDTLLADTFHGLHFMGHGELDPATGDGFLVLEDDAGNAAPCSARDLAIQLADRTSLRFVFLNACSTANDSIRRPFSGLAAALLRTGVPAVLAMQQPVSDQGAITFSRAVYRELASGSAIETAVSEGRLAIHRLDPQGHEWASPVLFLRSDDTARFERPKKPDTSKSSTFRRLLGAVVVTLVLTLGWRMADSTKPSRPRQETGIEQPARPRAMAVREGQSVELPGIGAVSVTFSEHQGVPFARLVVAVDGEAKVHSKTLMGPTTLPLDDGRTVSVQSINWDRREILALALVPDP